MKAEQINIAEIRQNLEKERTRVKKRMRSHAQQNQRQTQRNRDSADLAQSYTQQEQNVLLSERDEVQLTQIENALQKIKDGQYGVCDICGQAIAPGRLAVIPYANLCITCQSQQ